MEGREMKDMLKEAMNKIQDFRKGRLHQVTGNRTGEGIIFSLCHTTARLPDGWREAAQAWLDNADHPEAIEHVLTMDEAVDVEPIFPNTIIGVNHGAKTAVAGWNLSGELSRGKFLITLADDWFPCPHWDTELMKVLEKRLGTECVLDVNTGGNHHLLTFSLLTRKYYERLGFLFYSEYTGMYADNDFTDSARMDGVIVDARHLLFEHRHPNYTPGAVPDAIHLWQGRPEAYRIGWKVYRQRCAAKGIRIQPRLALCFPGESFSLLWVAHCISLCNALSKEYAINPILSYSSSASATRQVMTENFMAGVPHPDFILWIDDDNIVSYQDFKRLADTLDAHQEADMVAGWCWINAHDDDEPRISVGMFDENSHYTPGQFEYRDLMSGDEDVKEVDHTGFPVVLMRYEAMEKVMETGDRPFAYIPAPGTHYGFYGEDLSFCKRLKAVGGRIFVDRRVKVPHLKLRPAEPSQKVLRDHFDMQPVKQDVPETEAVQEAEAVNV